MRNIKNVLRTKRNNRGLFLQLSVFALFGIMTLFSGQISGQKVETVSGAPITTVVNDPLYPGGPAAFSVTSGPGTVTIDHVNAGTGLQILEAYINPLSDVTVNLPTFTPGTLAPVVVTFTGSSGFQLYVRSLYHGAFIIVQP